MIVAAMALVGLAIVGPTLISAIGGRNFAGAYVPMITYAIAVSLFLAGTTMRSALSVSGHQAAVLRSAMFATLVYLVTLVPSIKLLGTVGASVAQIAFSAVALVVTARSFRATFGADRSHDPSPATTRPD